MIISASRRTDIPAFYAEWFLNRLKAGYALVRNPFNPKQVTEIDLRPEMVDCIVFWTKNPTNMMLKLDEIDKRGYAYYFQYTVTPYNHTLEKRVPDVKLALKAFKELSRKIGPERVVWRYDPVLLTEKYTMDAHFKWFKYMAQELKGLTEKCVISFIDMYKKCEKNLKGVSLMPIDVDIMQQMSRRFADIADEYSLSIASCAEEISLEDFGIKPGKCIDDRLVSRITGRWISLPKDKHQRRFCRCVVSRDIGAYDICLHGCRYCYANASPNAAVRNFQNHDPESPFLIGNFSSKEEMCKFRPQMQYELF